ncbi:Uncharacterised protein [Cedecea neteri]|uniref:Uncharacterized protein n=1 Tax=Cedecea neteri TaxID=158822 RepID=A0A2X2SYB0_9ENTR|nr:Uncharacterised protein [Cedecea neteri]
MWTSKLPKNDYEQRALEFTQTLYKAMSDVDNALSLRMQLMAQENASPDHTGAGTQV